jgi:hypothetical protein
MDLSVNNYKIFKIILFLKVKLSNKFKMKLFLENLVTYVFYLVLLNFHI